MGESTSVTFLPSAYTAYPVTGPEEGGLVTGCHVTKRVPSCGPASTWISCKSRENQFFSVNLMEIEANDLPVEGQVNLWQVFGNQCKLRELPLVAVLEVVLGQERVIVSHER